MGTFHRWQLLQTVTEDVTRRGTEMSDGTNGEAARESPIRAGFRSSLMSSAVEQR